LSNARISDADSFVMRLVRRADGTFLFLPADNLVIRPSRSAPIWASSSLSFTERYSRAAR
jgi:hypothetical protein